MSPTSIDEHLDGRIHVLEDARIVRIRRLRPQDAPRLRAMLLRASPRTRYLRFLTPMPRVTDRFVHLLSEPALGGGGFVAEAGDDLVGVAHHGPMLDGDSEVAVLVEDDWQGRGLGRLLMARLMEALVDAGATSISGTVLRDNAASLGMLEGAFDAMHRTLDGPHMDFRARVSDRRARQAGAS